MDTKETQELLIAVNECGLVLVKQLKDGFQLTDFEAFYTKFVADTEFRAKLQAAWEGREKVVAELQDLGLFEIIGLAQIQMSYVPKLIAALKP